MYTPIEIITWPDQEPECFVLNEDTRTVVSDFTSLVAAQAWIADTHYEQERQGLPQPEYRIIPCRVSPGGRDIR